LLLAKKADVNAKTNRGFTPLHIAAFNGHKEVTAFLLANGANVNATSDQGLTPLRCAERNDHKDVADLLRQHGGYKLPDRMPEWPYP
jgi:ankyrin repeat protein